MNSDSLAKIRLAEIAALVAERERESKKLQILDRRIAELVEVIPDRETRKNRRQTFSPKDFARGCGL